MSMFIVERTGELVECTNKEAALDSANVIIVVSPNQKKIYTWIGNNASPQSKFACARETARMRMETGYKVINLEEKDTTQEFLSAVEEATYGTDRVVRTQQYKPEVRSEVRTKSHDNVGSVTSTKTVQVETVKEREKSMDYESQILLKDTDASLIEMNVHEIVEQLDKLPPITGKIRDYIIIRDKLFVAPMEKGNWNSLEEVMLDDGSFIAEDYVSRILIRNGKVSAIELWRDA